MSPNDFVPSSGQYWTHLCLPSSTHLVVMTTTKTLFSHSSRQKSATVFFVGPGGRQGWKGGTGGGRGGEERGGEGTDRERRGGEGMQEYGRGGGGGGGLQKHFTEPKSVPTLRKDEGVGFVVARNKVCMDVVRAL